MLELLSLAALMPARPTASSAAVFPLDLSMGVPVVEARVGGVKDRFILDSGSDVSYLDLSSIEAMVGKGLSRPVGPPGFYEVGDVRLGSAGVSRSLFKEGVPPVVGYLSAEYGHRIRGILGYSALRFLSLGIDFEKRVACAWGPGRSRQADSDFRSDGHAARLLPIECQNGSPEVPISVDGRPVYAVLDLASTSGLVPYPASRWCGEECSVGSMVRVHSANAITGERRVIPEEVEIAGVKLRCPAFLEGEGAASLFAIGWTDLAPFHRALISFDGGFVDLPSRVPLLNGADTVLCLGRAEMGASGDRMSGFAGLSGPARAFVRRSGVAAASLALGTEKQWRRLARAVARLELFSLSPRGHELLARSASFAGRRGTRSEQPPDQLGHLDGCWDGPGVYLAAPGKAARKLPTGPVKEADVGSLVSVGGIMATVKEPGGSLTVPDVLDELCRIEHPPVADFVALATGGSGLVLGGRVPVCVPPGSLVETYKWQVSAPMGRGWTAYFPPGWTPRPRGLLVPPLPSETLTDSFHLELRGRRWVKSELPYG